MNREDIIKLAREADLICESRPVTAWIESTDLTPYLTRFAALVAAAEQAKFSADLIEYGKAMAAVEREACAKVCDLVAREIDDTNGTATYIAAAIRARGNT